MREKKLDKFKRLAAAMEQELRSKPHLPLHDIEAPFKDELGLSYQDLKRWMTDHGQAFPLLFRSYIKAHGQNLPMQLKRYALPENG